MSDLKPAPEATEETSLRGGQLGIIGIVFFVVAAAAPLVGMTGAAPVAIVAGNGAAAPGAYVAVGLILVLFSVGYAAMSAQVTNVGAFFAFIGRGLGIVPGVGSAFVSLLAYIGIQLAVFGFFGGVIAGQMAESLGINLPWYVWTLLAWAIVTALSALSVDIGAMVLGLLMTLELLSLVVTSFAVFFSGNRPEGIDFGASFSPVHVFEGGLAGTAGIALAFAFASFIGFEATAIYGEESKDPHRTVPRATYLAVGTITVIFAFTTFAMVSGLGASAVVDKTVELSTVDGEVLANPANVLFTVASTYVGPWMATAMSWLVISSLFAGLLAFQNSAARYFFAMGRGGVLPKALEQVNRRGAPWIATLTTAAITFLVIATFALLGWDPITKMFFWFSGIAVLAIVFVEILVSLAVIVFFRRNAGLVSPWTAIIAPGLSVIGLALGLYLLASRFGLLAGTVAEGVDPTAQAWGLSPLGWFLVLSPFLMFGIGIVVGILRGGRENRDAVADLVT